jgi:hypothetical protein
VLSPYYSIHPVYEHILTIYSDGRVKLEVRHKPPN